VKKPLALLILPVALVAACSSQTSGSPHSTPVATQAESLGCGKVITGTQTTSHDPIQLSIASIPLGSTSVGVVYRITENRPHQTLSAGSTSVAAYLTQNGKVVGYSTAPQPNRTTYALDKGAYEGTLNVGTLCTGTTWQEIRKPSNGYMITVVMPQPAAHGQLWITREPVVVQAT
jgi:hypothetical protein